MRSVGRQLPAKLVGLAAQLFVGQGADGRFERIDGAHSLTVLTDQSVVAAAEYFLEETGNHAETRWAAQKRMDFTTPLPL